MAPGLKPTLGPEATSFLSLIIAAFTLLQGGAGKAGGDALSA